MRLDFQETIHTTLHAKHTHDGRYRKEDDHDGSRGSNEYEQEHPRKCQRAAEPPTGENSP